MVLVVLAVVSLSGCGSLFKGDKGDAGVSLIKTYTGVMTGATMQTISVPEIKGKPETTFVLAYYSFSTSPTVWTPMSDGWLDSSLSNVFSVSWTAGTVNIYQGFAGDNYMLKVYQNN